MADKYITIKTSNKEAAEKILNRESGIELSGLNVMQDALKSGVPVFIVLGGDHPSWDAGLIGIGTVSKSPYDIGYEKNNYRIQIDINVLLDKPITREDLIPYRDTYGIIAIGPALKGEPNQAVTTMTKRQAAYLIHAIAELHPEAIEDIKELYSSVDTELLNSAFGATRKMIEVSVPFGATEEDARDLLCVDAGTEEMENGDALTVKAYESLSLDERKNTYIQWMKTIKKPAGVQGAGNPYSETVIVAYANALARAASRLSNFTYGNPNFFYYTDDTEFSGAEAAAKAEPDYGEVDRRFNNQGWSAAIAKYHEFLSSLNNDNNNDNDEETVSILKELNCFDVERSPRTVKIHPLDFIIYGAPGTGKTYSTAEYALAIIENRNVDKKKKSDAERKSVMEHYYNYVKKEQIVFTTFHQSYGYEEFIQGLRPDIEGPNMSFKKVDGVFKRIADNALRDSNNNYVIIIDEINRANISKVFGELITLIEEDKRWGEINQQSATLQSGDPFAVPNNLYIIGTMNSADKSISLIDAALRRRFEFIEQYPDSSLVEDSTLQKVLEKMNKYLADSLESSDLLIGHSYFMGKNKNDLCDVLNNSIIPLLYEYYYDNKKKVKATLDEALDGINNIKIVDNTISRIRVMPKEQ